MSRVYAIPGHPLRLPPFDGDGAPRAWAGEVPLPGLTTQLPVACSPGWFQRFSDDNLGFPAHNWGKEGWPLVPPRAVLMQQVTSSPDIEAAIMTIASELERKQITVSRAGAGDSSLLLLPFDSDTNVSQTFTATYTDNLTGDIIDTPPFGPYAVDLLALTAAQWIGGEFLFIKMAAGVGVQGITKQNINWSTYPYVIGSLYGQVDSMDNLTGIDHQEIVLSDQVAADQALLSTLFGGQIFKRSALHAIFLKVPSGVVEGLEVPATALDLSATKFQGVYTGAGGDCLVSDTTVIDGVIQLPGGIAEQILQWIKDFYGIS